MKEIHTATFPGRYKTILIGESNVGKSSLILRLAGRAWDPYSVSTIGMAFSIHTVSVGGKDVQLECWDSAGQERFHSIVPLYFKGVSAVILVYDVTNEISRQKILNYWLPTLKDYFDVSRPHIFVVGNKIDLLSQEDNNVLDSKTHQTLQEICYMARNRL
jgi:small GTP-binding protein